MKRPFFVGAFGFNGSWSLNSFFRVGQQQPKANECGAADAAHPTTALTATEPVFGTLGEERVAGVYAKQQRAECTYQNDELWGVVVGWVDELWKD